MANQPLDTARRQLKAAKKTKRESDTINVPVDAVCEAFGEASALARTLTTMRTELIRRQALDRDHEDYVRQPAVTCEEVAGDVECPLTGPIVLRSRASVDVARGAYITALQALLKGGDGKRQTPKESVNDKTK